VTLSVASDVPVTVDYATADGWAAAGDDYQAAAGTVTFAPGQTSQAVTVLVSGDRVAEPTEDLFVNLTGPTNADIADGQGLGVIVDDDPYVSVWGTAVAEGNAGTTELAFTVSLSTASDLPVTVDYATSDWSALAGEDYAAASGTVTFAPGETFQTITVLVNGDPDQEYDEYLFVTLSNAAGASIDVGEAWGTILSDDGVAIAIADTSGWEDSSSFGFVVTLSAPSDETVTVYFNTVGGSAEAWSDYWPADGTLVFAPGETSQIIWVTVFGDADWEYDEQFYVILSGPSSNAFVQQDWGTGTILNDDPSWW
jgi:hypothetical protein